MGRRATYAPHSNDFLVRALSPLRRAYQDAQPRYAHLQVNAEATVELAYSLSEHGLTPAAFRAFAVAMERIQDTQQVLRVVNRVAWLRWTLSTVHNAGSVIPC